MERLDCKLLSGKKMRDSFVEKVDFISKLRKEVGKIEMGGIQDKQNLQFSFILFLRLIMLIFEKRS